MTLFSLCGLCKLDRGNDNWLIKIDQPKETEGSEDWEEVGLPILRIAAIDNGLAFPFKHPDSWRTYPFGWALLAAARVTQPPFRLSACRLFFLLSFFAQAQHCPQVPFSAETKAKFLPKLIDPDWTENLTKELRRIAQIDLDYNESQFNKQMSVLRGQMFNLSDALIKQKSPMDLVVMDPMTIRHEDNDKGFRRKFLSTRLTSPFFSSW